MSSHRLAIFIAFAARRYGPRAVAALSRAGSAWLADPANEITKRQLIVQLERWGKAVGPQAARSVARIVSEIERRRVTVGAWERDLMDLRHDLPGFERGPIRDGALRAYEAQVRAGVHVVNASRRPQRTRRAVLAALRAERTMLQIERLTDAERRRLTAAIAATHAAVNTVE